MASCSVSRLSHPKTSKAFVDTSTPIGSSKHCGPPARRQFGAGGLPAAQVVWLVIGMALFRNREIAELVQKLDLALPGSSPEVAPSAVPKARARVGDEPLAWIFTRCADEWAHASADRHRWRGLAVYGVDGSTLKVADSAENRAHFGGSCGPRGESGYPLLHMAGLMALRSHLLASVAFGAYDIGEHG